MAESEVGGRCIELGLEGRRGERRDKKDMHQCNYWVW